MTPHYIVIALVVVLAVYFLFIRKPAAPKKTLGLMSAGPLNDTHPKIEALLIEGYRKMSPSQKLERVRALTRAVQELALAE